jgi:hypothetical protein
MTTVAAKDIGRIRSSAIVRPTQSARDAETVAGVSGVITDAARASAPTRDMATRLSSRNA